MNTVTTRRSATLVLTMEQRLARCATPMTKHQLFGALTGNGRLSINGIPVILSAIMREDGSGSSFILTVYSMDNNSYRCYCRTID